MRHPIAIGLAILLSLASCRSTEREALEIEDDPQEVEETIAGVVLPSASSHELVEELLRVQLEDEPSAVRPDFDRWECAYLPPLPATCDALVPSLWRAPDGSHWVVEMGGIHGRGRYCYGPYWLVEDRLFPDPR